MNEYEILLIWDDEARVWIAQNDDIPLVLENGSLDLLMEQVRIAALLSIRVTGTVRFLSRVSPFFIVPQKLAQQRENIFEKLVI
jgi:hypothetical protein